MKLSINKVLVIFLILIGGMQKIMGQTALEKAMNVMGVRMDIPSFFIPSQNEDLIYVTDITEKDPIPKMAQTYDYEPSFGNTAFKVYFGRLHSILKRRDSDYLIFVYAAGEADIKYGKLIRDNTKLFKINNSSFNRIKGDFRYGKRMTSASEEEIHELDLMLIHYPKEKAHKMFNADWMVTYPYNLRGNVYEDHYTRCRAVVVSKNGLDLFFYFMMTDQIVKEFDRYLEDLNNVFRFKE